MIEAKPRRTFAIRGVLTLTAHTHQTSPDGKTEGLASQIHTSVISRRTNPPALVPKLPYITANSVRGMLRRAAGGVIMRALAQAKDKVSRNLYLSILRGAFSRTGINAGGATYQQIVAAQDHLFGGLFGGGANMYPSKMRVERDLFPMIECIGDLFPQRYQAQCINIAPHQAIENILIASRDDFERLPQQDIIENEADAYMEHMAAKFGANQAKREQKAAAKADKTFVAKNEKLKSPDLNGFGQVEALIPGLPLYFGLTAKDVTDAQFGLLLAAVATWANLNALGGGSVRGRGSFLANLQVFEGENTLAEQLLVNEAPNYKLSDTLEVFSAAMQSELAQAATPAALGAVYPSEVAAPKEPKAKKAA